MYTISIKWCIVDCGVITVIVIVTVVWCGVVLQYWNCGIVGWDGMGMERGGGLEERGGYGLGDVFRENVFRENVFRENVFRENVFGEDVKVKGK